MAQCNVNEGENLGTCTVVPSEHPRRVFWFLCPGELVFPSPCGIHSAGIAGGSGGKHICTMDGSTMSLYVANQLQIMQFLSLQ